jgi:hypothetical protein
MPTPNKSRDGNDEVRGEGDHDTVHGIFDGGSYVP